MWERTLFACLLSFPRKRESNNDGRGVGGIAWARGGIPAPFVIPAKAGIHPLMGRGIGTEGWIPVCTGMTEVQGMTEAWGRTETRDGCDWRNGHAGHDGRGDGEHADLELSKAGERRRGGWLRGRDLNPRPLGYACHYGFRRLGDPVCGLDFLFIHGPACAAAWMPAIKSLHLPATRHALRRLGSGLPRYRLPRI